MPHRSLLALLLALMACADEAQPDTLAIADGASHGALVSRTVDGTRRETLRLVTGAELEIPSGALSSEVRISMQRPPDATARRLMERLGSGEQAASAPYILKPHGQTFSRPAKLTLPIARAQRDQPIAAAWLEDEDGAHWQRLQAERTGPEEATVLLEHFSVVMLVVADGDEPPSADEPDSGAPEDATDGATDGSFDAGPGMLDSGDPVADTGICLPGTVDFLAMVVDATNPAQTVPGITVEVLEGDNGLPLRPPVTGVSRTDGRVTLTVDRCRPFAVKARGNDNYIDTFTSQLQPAASGQPDALIRMASNNWTTVIPAVAQYPVMPDRAPVTGAVYWKTPDMPLYDVVGCAQIETPSGTVPDDWALRYFMAALPSSPSDWPLGRGTRKNDGRFFLGNVTPGIHTLVATVNGEQLGKTDVVVFPRSMGGTRVSGSPELLFLAGIYVDAPAGAVNPTPADCQR